LLEELKIFISLTELEQSVFHSNHASNYLILKGTLGRDKHRMLDEIEAALNNSGGAGMRPKWLRGL